MQGILDYAELRKDITFQERGFNPVDALIFSVLSYVDWEEVVNEAERPLSEACALFLQRREGADFARIFAYSPLIPRLLELLKDSVRYREVTMGDYRNVFDEAQEIQFAAVTMKLPDGALFLSFRRLQVPAPSRTAYGKYLRWQQHAFLLPQIHNVFALWLCCVDVDKCYPTAHPEFPSQYVVL